MTIRAAILARVSDAKQLAVGGDGGRHTLAGQFETLERMAAREGWLVVRTFEIPGETAYSDEYAARPLFAAAVAAAVPESERWTCVCGWKSKGRFPGGHTLRCPARKAPAATEGGPP